MVLKRSSSLRRRGFTFVELCMALVVCAMIFSAIAAFSLAMGRSWEGSQTTQASGLRAAQIMLRLQSELRPCKAVLYCSPGSLTNAGGIAPAALFLWRSDNSAASALPDGKLQYSELELIEFVPPTSTTTGTINVYKANPPANADSQWATTFCATAAGATSFKSGLTPAVLATHTDGMAVSVQWQSDLTQNPVIEFRLLFKGTGQTADKIRYGSITLRGPKTPTD